MWRDGGFRISMWTGMTRGQVKFEGLKVDWL